MTNPPQQDPYAQNPYGENPQGQQSPYGQQNPYGQAAPAGQDPYAQNPYAQSPYGQQTPYGQQPGYGQGPADPYGQQAAYGTQPYGYYNQMATAPMRPKMGMGQSIKAFFQNYARFNGRAGLSEFWWAQLGVFLISLALSILSSAFTSQDGHSSAISDLFYIIYLIWGLAIIVPNLALEARRLHDANHSGWLLLLHLIPLIGTIILIVFWCGASRPEGARFDSDTQPRTGN